MNSILPISVTFANLCGKHPVSLCIEAKPAKEYEQRHCPNTMKRITATSGGSRIFPGGGAPTPKVGVLIYYFCRKLHENERIWTPRGGARPWRPPWIRQWQLT